MKLHVDDIPPPPTEPTYGQSCDGGHCNAESVGWRFYPFPAPGQWLPVCHRDLNVKGVPARFRVLDSDLEEAQIGKAVDHSVRPAIDRALERDHSLCGAEPCSDCR